MVVLNFQLVDVSVYELLLLLLLLLFHAIMDQKYDEILVLFDVSFLKRCLLTFNLKSGSLAPGGGGGTPKNGL